MGLLEIDRVTKSFGTHQVLKEFCMDVDEHEVVVLIGASGSGKSTLLKCINALEPIDSGQIRVAGTDMHDRWTDLDYMRRDIGIVFQQYNLFPRMTVLQNVTLAPRKVLGIPRARAEQRARELLGRVGLADKADCYPDKLSGGQQQRVAIARAMAMEPKALLLDEITSALDPELVGEVLGIVRQLADDGMTLMLATHEMAFAREVADRVCFLVDGVIYEEGPPEVIFENPERELTQAFLRRIIAAGRL